MALMVAAQSSGNDATISLLSPELSGLGSSFELNVMMPVIAYNLLQSIELLLLPPQPSSPTDASQDRPPTKTAAKASSNSRCRCVQASPR